MNTSNPLERYAEIAFGDSPPKELLLEEKEVWPLANEMADVDLTYFRSAPEIALMIRAGQCTLYGLPLRVKKP